MAFDFSKLNFFNRLDARARVLVLFGAVLGVILLVYLGTRYLSGGSSTVGPSRVASAPQGLQSVPGGTTQTAEYQRALLQANQQRAEAAKMTGESAIPTEVNTGEGLPSSNGSSCIICSDQTASVNTLLDDWVKKGKLSPEVASELESLAAKNVPVDQYAAQLAELVKEGKLTPEQARLLLQQYEKQHQNALLNDSAQTMDALIKTGQLPLDAANQLLNDQKNSMSPSQYAAQLQELVREGKISPQVAQQLLAQYTKQFTKEVTMKSIATLQAMSRDGELSADVLKQLTDLENQMVPMDLVSDTLQKLVAAGKLAPATSQKVMDEYKEQKAEIGPGASMQQLIEQAESAAFEEISNLLAAKKITPDVAADLTGMIQNNVPLDDFKAAVQQLVAQKKLTPDIATLKIGDYTKVKELRDMQQSLAALAANNASPDAYAAQLKQMVAAGIITPDQAAEMLQEYQALTTKNGGFAATNTQPATFAGAGAGGAGGAGGQFAAAQAQAAQESDADRQARIQNLMSAMSGQATQLVNSWQPTNMVHRGGAYENGCYPKGGPTCAKQTTGTMASGLSSATSGTTSAATDLTEGGIPIIKSGTIIFAVLDTTVNSDYPDSPVMATIVQGKYKGAKLLGKLTTTKSVSGQLDRISLNFTIMNMDQWDKSKTVTAYAIDPDTARTVLASSVNYHYLMKYGAIFATSFVQGYASAIQTSASTSTTGIFGTSTTHPELSPSQKLATAIGQIGTNLSSVTANYVNIPPTVRVDSGVSLGILFMADVT